MKKHKLAMLCAVGFAMVTLTAMPQRVYASEDSQEYTESEPYYSDAEFEEFYNAEKDIVINGSEEASQGALMNLYNLAKFGGMTKKQLEQVLNDGLLISNLDEFKEAELVDGDFTPAIGEGDTTYNYTKEVTEVAYKDVVFPEEDPLETHNFENLTDEAEIALLNSTVDFYPDNTYIKVRETAPNKVINGQVFNAATINGTTGIYIDFTDDDYKVTRYRWYPTGWIVSETSSYDLGIEYDESHIHFNEQKKLPRPAGISIKMEKPETMYNIFYANGTLQGSYESDENGFITMLIEDATDYKVSTGGLPFTTATKKKLEDVKRAWQSVDFGKPSVLIILGLEGVLLVLFIWMVARGIISIKKK